MLIYEYMSNKSLDSFIFGSCLIISYFELILNLNFYNNQYLCALGHSQVLLAKRDAYVGLNDFTLYVELLEDLCISIKILD